MDYIIPYVSHTCKCICTALFRNINKKKTNNVFRSSSQFVQVRFFPCTYATVYHDSSLPPSCNYPLVFLHQMNVLRPQTHTNVDVPLCGEYISSILPLGSFISTLQVFQDLHSNDFQIYASTYQYYSFFLFSSFSWNEFALWSAAINDFKRVTIYEHVLMVI